MRLSIYSYKGVLFSGEAKFLQIPASSGMMEIMDRHEPTVAMLKPGCMRFMDNDDQEHKLNVCSGVVEALQSRVEVLIDSF